MLSKQGAARALAVIVVVVAAASLAGRASAVAPENDSFDCGCRAHRPLGHCVRHEQGRDERAGRARARRRTRRCVRVVPLDSADGRRDHDDDVWQRDRHAARRIHRRCREHSDRGREQRRRLRLRQLDHVHGGEAGQRYRIAVDGVDGETGLFNLQLRLAPPNDDFADAVVVSGDVGSVAGTNDGASLEASEPGNVSGSVWYRWTAPSTGPATFMTCGATFDTAIAAYIRVGRSSL